MTYFIRYSNNTTFTAHEVKTKITAATILNDTILYIICYEKREEERINDNINYILRQL